MFETWCATWCQWIQNLIWHNSCFLYTYCKISNDHHSKLTRLLKWIAIGEIYVQLHASIFNFNIKRGLVGWFWKRIHPCIFCSPFEIKVSSREPTKFLGWWDRISSSSTNFEILGFFLYLHSLGKLYILILLLPNNNLKCFKDT